MIRRIKLLYVTYNFFQKKKLIHNELLYKKIGLKKRYFSSVSSNDFAHIDPSLLVNNHNLIDPKDTDLFHELDDETKAHVLAFDDNGYAVLPNYLTSEEVDAINEDIEHFLENGQLKFNEVNKIMFAIKKSARLKAVANNPKLISFLSSIAGYHVKLFQSINFIEGSQQKTHSDSIHMTTFPLGGLLGVWIALEDIEQDAGALHYYPGSHKLPYYLNSDYQNEGSAFLLGNKGYVAYEKMIEDKIQENQLEKKVFTAKKGDVLIWHANLLHGGEAHTNKEKTRKSVVFHYFNTTCICYHEITQRPALIEQYD